MALNCILISPQNVLKQKLKALEDSTGKPSILQLESQSINNISSKKYGKEDTLQSGMILPLQVSDSFHSNDPFAQAQHAHQQAQMAGQNVMPLQKPPRWLQKPAGANFGVSTFTWL